jgi:hypothetical protein
MYLEEIGLDIEVKRNEGCSWDAEYTNRLNMWHGWGTVCMLPRLAEGIWPCKLENIKADPKWKWYRLARKKIGQQIVHAEVKLDQGETRCMKNGKVVRQGCYLAPILFKLYSKYPTICNYYQGCSIKFGDSKIGVLVRNVKYVDDLVLLAKE